MEAPMANEAPLSSSQFEVLRLVNLGFSNQEIAQSLRISVSATKWHLHEILRKLAVHNRTAAAAKARSLGLI
jgi:ATP/maltotriose-dependent transcriptional regulator MalT